ncbi:MAG TPA: AsmA-like C-terminal region-containing protein [Bryobacteraceae bacterium]|nr:AsmA-like C-terminal region-containing protein [Bryobacteraceae bacterium]
MPSPQARKILLSRKWLIAFTVVALVLLTFLAALFHAASSLSRDYVVEALSEKYQSDVELEELNLSLLPSIRATGHRLSFRHKGRTDVPPLIEIQEFRVQAGIIGLLRSTKRVSKVELIGMKINVPPRREDKAESEEPKEKKSGGIKTRFVIEEIVADGTALHILPKDSWKEPLVFDIKRLTLTSVGIDRPMEFRAGLTNAKPPGDIESTGEFGPWVAGDPGLTPVSGKYTFENANLGVFKGIGGTLSSVGKYKGALARIEVEGTTDTPDFVVDTAGNPVHLKTSFHAIVDGTNGDTKLQPVNAEFLKTSVVARGGVEGKAGQKGKTVALDVQVSEGRIEDLLELAVKSDEPVVTGAIRFTTAFELPPGDQAVMDKLRLKGRFGVEAAEFSSSKVQEKIDELSNRARGEPERGSTGEVESDLKGNFTLANGMITLSGLSFSIPGATVHLNGTYGLRGEEINFRGTVRMQAKVSETTTGVKSFFLKLADPFFKKKGAGAVIPIKIGGTRKNPSFGLDAGRVIGGK